MEEIYDSDLAKELLTILSNTDLEFINKLPSNFLNELSFVAADSNKEFFIQKNKSLKEQNISEECKDLLSFLYYSTLDSKDKEILLDNWLKNDINNN